jgi:hypothetical protein
MHPSDDRGPVEQRSTRLPADESTPPAGLSAERMREIERLAERVSFPQLPMGETSTAP